MHKQLFILGFPEPFPDMRDILLVFLGSTTALVLYYIVLGRGHRCKRKEITLALAEAHEVVERLQNELREVERLEKEEESEEGGKKIRIFMDGAFDLMHYGHVNAFRLGRSWGQQLIVGVNSSETITQCKGPPVMTDE